MSPLRRRVVSDATFDGAVELLGGYERLDDILAPVIDGLYRNPYGYRLIENDFVRCRYVTTKAVKDFPAFLILFSIEDDATVVLREIEHFEDY